MRFAPVLTLLARSHRSNHQLKRDLVEARERNRSLQARLGVALRERDLAQRDGDTLALMARDRKVALEFIRDQHRIDRLDELPEGA